MILAPNLFGGNSSDAPVIVDQTTKVDRSFAVMTNQ